MSTESTSADSSKEADTPRVEVLPPAEDKEVEKIKVLVETLAGPVMTFMASAQEHEKAKVVAQLEFQWRNTLLAGGIVVLAMGAAAFFAWRALEAGRYDFMERIVVLTIGLTVGFLSGRAGR